MSRSSHVRALVLALVLVATIGAAVAIAAADSQVTLRIGNGGQFKGKVSSSADGCVVGRKVLIIETLPKRRRLGKTYASESGRYAFDVPADAGFEWFAKVKSYETPGGTLCRADRSRKVNAG
jgi:hypothetical protein